MAELVDAPDLGSGVFGREGSSPFIRIKAEGEIVKVSPSVFFDDTLYQDI